jgi:glutaconate CoA-transferase subunit B
VRQSRRTFVERLDFITSVGHGAEGTSRRELGGRGAGPTVVITDLGILRPHPESRELVLTCLHPGVRVEEAVAATGWPLAVAEEIDRTDPPTGEELSVLRSLRRREGSGE